MENEQPAGANVKILVKSAVIDWQAQTMEIESTAGRKHTIPLDTTIRVTMVGFPDREEQTMQAYYLGQYMSRGYVIEQIELDMKP